MARPFPIPFPLSSAPGANPQESSGRLINCAAEPLDNAQGPKVVWRRRPGLSKFTDLTIAGYRGSILVGSLAYVAVGTNVVTVDSSGTVTTLTGSLPGTDRVTFARNNAATPDIQVVSPANGAFSISGGVVSSFNGGGALPVPNSVAAQDAYFFWTIGDNRVFAAGPNSTSVNALTFITVQSRPTGNLIRAVPYQGLMWFFATNFCEVWQDQALPAPGFPYARYAVIDLGLFGRNAIAGWEDGFGTLIFVANDFGVYQVGGTAPTKISPPDLDRLIEGQKNTPDAVFAFVYVTEGKKFFVLNCANWHTAWEYNLNTQGWNERDSNSAGNNIAWRAAGSLLAFNKWMIADSFTTNLLYIDPSSQQEFGTSLRSRMESGPVNNFPARAAIIRADFNFVTGVGQSALSTQTGQNPQVGISCSRDGGYTWDNPRLRALGQAANGEQRVYATRFGLSTNQGPRFRLDLSDEVYASFMGATCSNDIRAV